MVAVLLVALFSSNALLVKRILSFTSVKLLHLLTYNIWSFFYFSEVQEKPLLCPNPSETILHSWVPICEDASTTTTLLQINLPWLVEIWVWNKYSQLINVQFLWLRWNTCWKSQKRGFATFVVECQTMKMHQMPQHSCIYVLSYWWRFEFGTSAVSQFIHVYQLLL